MGIRNPNDPMIFEILRRLRDLETAAPGGSTAVSRGRTRFLGNESVHVEGSGKVSGWWIVTGVLRVVGSLQMLGNMIVEGIMTLTGEIIVAAGGKIQLGTMTLTPSSNGGAVKFADGPEIYADGPTINIYSTSGGAWLELGPTEARLFGPGVEHLRITNTGFQMVNLPTKTAAATGLPVGVLHVDSNGNLYRIV